MRRISAGYKQPKTPPDTNFRRTPGNDRGDAYRGYRLRCQIGGHVIPDQLGSPSPVASSRDEDVAAALKVIAPD